MSVKIKRYSDFATIEKRFDGDKIKIDDIINKEIIIHDFKIKKSIQDTEKDYLTLHIEFEGERYICFTGSKVLIDQIKACQSEIPFFTTIRKIHRYYTFS